MTTKGKRADSERFIKTLFGQHFFVGIVWMFCREEFEIESYWKSLKVFTEFLIVALTEIVRLSQSNFILLMTTYLFVTILLFL